MSTNVNPVANSLFFTKDDSQDLRLGDLAKAINLDELKALSKSWVLLGYPDDEGIQLNGGRVGARLAPDNIRKYFYRMTLPQSKKISIYDLGNLQIEGELKLKHESAQKAAKQVFESKKTLITLGGGHDYGFPDAAAFSESNIKNLKLKPLVINFDAHLDVRPDTKGFHSGTPFYRLLKQFHKKIDFVEVGIQAQCNSLAHKHWAKEHGAKIIDLKEVGSKGLLPSLQKNLKAQPKRPLWLSIDIDGFRSSEAPGCSQGFATGLKIDEFLPALAWLNSSFDLQGLGIYEVSPPLDQDDRTSKLAALILFHAIFQS